MSLGSVDTPAQPFPALVDPVARRVRRRRLAACVARVIPSVALRQSVDVANLSARMSALEARARAVEQRMESAAPSA
jgi:hypothetical protein